MGVSLITPGLGDGFFSIFNGTNSILRLHLAYAVYYEYFADQFIVSKPREKEVKSFIREYAIALLESYPDKYGSTGSSIPSLVHETYRKLLEADWLRVVKEHGHKKVQLTHHAYDFLNYLMNIKESLSEDITIPLTGIVDSLRTAMGPDGGPKSILNAFGATAALMQKLRQIDAHLVALEDDLFARKKHTENLNSLIANYMEDIMVNEIRPMMTVGNPLDYRHIVLDYAHNLKEDRQRLDAYAMQLVDRSRYKDRAQALEKIDDCLDKIIYGFDNIQDLLAQVQKSRSLIESRFQRIVSFMRSNDLSLSQSIKDHARLFAGLKTDNRGYVIESTDSYSALPHVLLLRGDNHYSERGLYIPPAPRKKFEATKTVIKPRDPRIEILHKLKKYWYNKMYPDKKVVLKDLNEYVPETGFLLGSDFPVATLRDYSVFMRLMHLTRAYDGYLSQFYIYEKLYNEDGSRMYVENKYMRFEEFKISRKSQGK